MPDVLRLEARDYTCPTRWRWRLTNADTGAFLADHDAELTESDWQCEAFRDLRHYLSWHVNDDTYDAYAANEARIVTEVGDWVGEQVFGTAIMNALARHRNATVRVTLPAGAEPLAFLPLELARSDGKTLAALGITLVIETGDGPAQPKEPVGERLRVLGLFSLPEQSSPLNLRRERHELVSLIRGIAANGRAADVKVLQYGVTRDRLRDVLTEAEGWDIIHVSGHGAPGELLLETADGTPDPVTADDLADLLDLARDRVKLITIAACWPAARSAREQRRLLHLPTPESQRHLPPERPSPPAHSPGALATELSASLGCAVLAMRYPVNDDFAIGLSGKLYALLANKGQPLPRAVAMTLQDLGRGDRHGQQFPALSLVAPAIFGATAAALTLNAPTRDATPFFRAERLKLANLPDQPERFVGRTGVMARASAALAAESGVPGVLLHGMPGGGKSACALELAYGHEDAFESLIWFKAPEDGRAIDGALVDFALTLERSVTRLPMIGTLADESKLDAFLPTLTEFMERTRILIVIDNAESLLTDSGQWRDEQWAKIFGALIRHRGYGRVIVTTRRVPAESSVLRGEAVDALSADEALLLARELPSLHALIRGQLPGVTWETSRKLALGILDIAQGHPKLLELAEGQASDPGRLMALTEAGSQAWREQGGLPDGFFGAVGAAPGDYLQVLAAWTKAVTNTLTPGERDLFWFLSCLEEPDRIWTVLDGNWTDLWEKLGRSGQPPGLDQALTAIASSGLVSIRPESSGEAQSYAVHPGVSVAGRDHAGKPFQIVIDAQAAAYWRVMHRVASGQDGDSVMDTALAVRAGLAAVPYLLRQDQESTAAALLEKAFIQEPSRANAAVVLPAITRLADRDSRWAGMLARVLEVLDPAAAEAQTRMALDAALSRSDYGAASAAAGRLVDLWRVSGQLVDALSLADQMIGYTQQADLGPWTQLGDQVQRLQVLNDMGRAEQVLNDVGQLRARMDDLPDHPGPNETVSPWEVREFLLSIASYASRLVGRQKDALSLNAEITASKRGRRATPADIARTQFNDYGPLLRLGRTDEALTLLIECRRAFHDAGDIRMLGNTLGALAATEHQRGHGDAAIRLEHDALRYKYQAADIAAIVASYHNLGNYRAIHARSPAGALAAHLTAALLRILTGIGSKGDVGAVVHETALDIENFGTAAELPADIAELCQRIGDIPGTDPARLVAQLSPDPKTAEQRLQELIEAARKLASPGPHVNYT